MPLGIEQNNLAPQLIANSGAALVQGIRQIGQQISGHLTEIQTKRDLGAMAQEAQNLNPESLDFPVQLMQLGSRHPMALRDERGQFLLSIPAKAHAQWQAGEAETRAFKRAMEMQGMRNTAAREQFDYEEAARSKRPVVVNGQLVQPDEIDETGYATALTPPPVGRGSTAMPFQATPNGPFDRRTGQYGTPPPAAPEKPMTQYQKKSLGIRERAEALSKHKIQLAAYEKDIDRLKTSIEKVDAAEVKKEDISSLAPSRLKWQQELLANKELRDATIKEIQKLETTAGQDDEVDAGVLPPVPATTELPQLSPADAAKLPSGSQFRDKNGNVRIVP